MNGFFGLEARTLWIPFDCWLGYGLRPKFQIFLQISGRSLSLNLFSLVPLRVPYLPTSGKRQHFVSYLLFLHPSILLLFIQRESVRSRKTGLCFYLSWKCIFWYFLIHHAFLAFVHISILNGRHYTFIRELVCILSPRSKVAVKKRRGW